jgi:hypothetical protein
MNGREKAHIEVIGGIRLRSIFEREDGMVWTVLVWIRIGTSGEHL